MRCWLRFGLLQHHGREYVVRCNGGQRDVHRRVQSVGLRARVYHADGRRVLQLDVVPSPAKRWWRRHLSSGDDGDDDDDNGDANGCENTLSCIVVCG